MMFGSCCGLYFSSSTFETILKDPPQELCITYCFRSLICQEAGDHDRGAGEHHRCKRSGRGSEEQFVARNGLEILLVVG